MPNQTDLDKLGKTLLRYPNVTGYAKTLQSRQRNKKIVDQQCLQIHVAHKVPEKRLRTVDILPKTVGGVPVDVVIVGPLKIPLPPKRKVSVKEKTDRISPLVAGISIGNAAITAGTLGAFMEKTTSPDKGEVFIGSNSHVIAEEPKNPTSQEKIILQPGSYDGGTEVVGEYYWHKQLYPTDGPSDCIPSNWVTDALNLLSRALHRKTRFQAILQEQNYIDFGAARIVDEWKNAFFDVEFPSSLYRFVGFGFAGSDTVSLVCKAGYVKAEGYMPKDYLTTEVYQNNILHKTGRTSCYSTAAVRIESAHEIVNFGAYNVEFDDVIVTDKMLDPGDSGSSIWRKE